MRLIYLLAAVVLALAAAATAYAAWTQQLIIKSQVATGKLDAGFTSVEYDDRCGSNTVDYNVPLNPVNFYQASPVDRDVGCTDASGVDLDGDGYYEEILVTLSNVYPGYYTSLRSYVLLDGESIPARQWRLVIESADGSKVYYRVYESNVTLIEDGDGLGLDLDGDGDYDVAVHWSDNLGGLLQPNGPAARFELKIAVLEGAPEGSTLQFRFHLELIQWNAYEANAPQGSSG